MKKNIKSIKGMNDYIDKKLHLYNYVIEICKNILNKYCYKEIKTPIIEQTDLFKISIGNNTDIIDQEMYSFYDKGGKHLTLRPEGTSGCIRSVIEHNLLYKDKIQKLWYFGPMYRHENTQKGRYREFHQFGVESIGTNSIYIELEIILITIKIWNVLGVSRHLKLEINSIGSIKEREIYKNKLNTFLDSKHNYIKKYYKKNYKKNPLRLFESKNSNIKKVLKLAPLLHKNLSKKTLLRFKHLCNVLKKFKIKYYINKNLVRGLSYYNDTVFEWKNLSLNKKNTVCAGGRYDKLAYILNGKKIPSFGFAIGIERLIILINNLKKNKTKKTTIDIEIIFLDNETILESISISEKIRKKFPTLKIFINFSNERTKKKLKKSYENKVKMVLFIGKQEIEYKCYSIKNLKNKEQKQCTYKELIKEISKLFF
ncbi:histidine--tRNA ligase [Buchnera aphidicola (Chaitoregma tattakana)]|uniref:histidine--tRNA ligase n=1 Tax=Buchnera aphidicola TaxID=9 RepID=UPI0031B86E9C